MTTTEPSVPAPIAPTKASKRRRAAHKAPKTLRGRVIEWSTIAVIAVLVALLVRAFVLQAFYIPTGSMEPTLGINNRVLVFRLAYDFGSIHPGDIVVFRTPPDDREADPGVSDLVKRVVGLPGQTISSAPDGQVLIDGKAIDESYIAPQYRTGPDAGPGICATGDIACSANGTFRIPKGEYFVMGDNRDDSYDSRYFGPISGSSIVGQVVMKVWPLDELTFY